MTRLRRTVLALAAASFATGCAYYNGLYNANQLVKKAARAEREGRVAEARALYSQAAVKAESVVVRYPDSDYRDDALLVQGLAFRSSGQCVRARGPLRQVLAVSADSSLRERARLALGECLVELGEMEEASDVLEPLTVSADPALASAARLYRGRALLARRAYEAAVVDLEASQVAAADFELAIAYASIGRPEAARLALERHGSGRAFEEARWLGALDSLGKRYPDAASTQVELLIARADLTSGQRSRLLLADGERWLRSDRPRTAASRFERAELVATEPATSRAALFRRITAELRVVEDVESLASLAEAWPPGEVSGTGASAEGVDLAHRLERVRRVMRGDSLLEHPDLELFLAAEYLRDSMQAPLAAAALFRELVDRYPSSAIAPKALLAAIPLLPPREADSLVAVLHRRYADSPYTMALVGRAVDAFTRLEDSLRTLVEARGDALRSTRR